MTAETIGALAAAAAGIGAALRWLGTKVVHLLHRAERQDVLLFGDDTPQHPGLEAWQDAAIDRLDLMDRRMMRVEAELFPNHGGSLRDVVDRIERAVIPRQREGR